MLFLYGDGVLPTALTFNAVINWWSLMIQPTNFQINSVSRSKYRKAHIYIMLCAYVPIANQINLDIWRSLILKIKPYSIWRPDLDTIFHFVDTFSSIKLTNNHHWQIFKISWTRRYHHYRFSGCICFASHKFWSSSLCSPNDNKKILRFFIQKLTPFWHRCARTAQQSYTRKEQLSWCA